MARIFQSQVSSSRNSPANRSRMLCQYRLVMFALYNKCRHGGRFREDDLLFQVSEASVLRCMEEARADTHRDNLENRHSKL